MKSVKAYFPKTCLYFGAFFIWEAINFILTMRDALTRACICALWTKHAFLRLADHNFCVFGRNDSSIVNGRR